MKKSKLILGVFFLMLAAAAGAQQRYELTVREAVDLAYKNVYQLKNAQLDYRIQEAKNKETLGQALPQVNGNVNANYYFKLPVILFPDASKTMIYDVLTKEGLLPAGTSVPTPILQQVSFQQPWNLTLGGTLTQLLFQPDVFVGLRARQTALDLATASIDLTRETIRDSAYKRYYAILIAQRQRDFLDSSLLRLERLYHDDSVMFVNGFAERLDLDKVQVQLNNLRTTRTVVNNAVELAYAGLKFAIGVSQNDVVVLKEELTNELATQDVLDNSFRYEDRPAVRALEYQRKLRVLDVKRNKLSILPTVSAAANYSVNAQGQDFFTNSDTRWLKSAYVGLSANLPIFNGFQRKYRIIQAQLNLEKTSNDLAYAKQGIDLEQKVSRTTWSNSILNLNVQQRNLELAERVFNATKLKFEQGLGSSFEVLQADTDYQTAQSNYFNALYNAVVARISYLSSIGKLQ